MKTNMNREATFNFINKVQEQVTPKIFENIKGELEFIPEKYYKLFLYLLYAGYPVKVIFKSYKNLYWFAQRNYLDSLSALKLITYVSSRVNTGMEVKDLTFFELN